MTDNSDVNVEMFNKDNLIDDLDWKYLAKLALLAINAMQLNKVAHAKNINYKVVTAVLSNNKVDLRDLDVQSILNLVKLSKNTNELCEIMRIVNANVFAR
jgi:hypothetical protein